MKTNLKGEIASTLLEPAFRARFSQLFGVASRKSVFAWHESAVPQAQVVMLDAHSDMRSLVSPLPCIIWVGAEAAGSSAPRSAWSGRLAANYTVSDLIDILDRAAVFLLDWKARQPAAAAAAGFSTSQFAPSSFADSVVHSVAPSTAATPGQEGRRYRLRSWIFLSAPFDGAECIAAMALLARQPVTQQQLQAHSGLSAVQAVDLLQELARRSVLQVISPAAAATPSAPSSSQPAGKGARAAPEQQGLVRRLSRWLKGART